MRLSILQCPCRALETISIFSMRKFRHQTSRNFSHHWQPVRANKRPELLLRGTSTQWTPIKCCVAGSQSLLFCNIKHYSDCSSEDIDIKMARDPASEQLNEWKKTVKVGQHFHSKRNEFIEKWTDSQRLYLVSEYSSFGFLNLPNLIEMQSGDWV